MELLLRSLMGKMGRPKKDEGEKGTTLVRVFDEMAEMIADLRLVLPLTTSQIMQRVGGNNLKELHDTHKPQIESVKTADRAAEEARRKATEEAARIEADKQLKKKPKTGP